MLQKGLIRALKKPFEALVICVFEAMGPWALGVPIIGRRRSLAPSLESCAQVYPPGLLNQDIYRSFLFVQQRQKSWKTRKIGKHVKTELILFRSISVMFSLVFGWFLMVRWCRIFVIKQNGKFHI